MVCLVARRVVASFAAPAMLMAGLLPPAHVHMRHNDSAIHRHVIGDDAAHRGQGGHQATSLDDDGHLAARILSVTCDAGAQFSLHRALTVTIVTAKETTGIAAMAGPASRATLLPTHDPPLRFICSPAPPASA